MEVDPAFAQAVMDAINGFNELERLAMRAAILADPDYTASSPFST